MRFNILNTLISLLFAVVIYLLFRTKVYMFIDQGHFPVLHDVFKGIQVYFKPLKAALPAWVIYSLPDGLWTYSFTSFFVLHFRFEPLTRLKIFALAFTPLLSISFEVGQHFQLFPGTFDFVDLFFDFAGSLLPFFLLGRHYAFDANAKRIMFN